MLKKIGIGFGIVIAGLLVLGLFLPKENVMEEEIVINKSKEIVFPHLKNLLADDWTVWQKKDPNIVKQFKGTDGEVGATASWTGNSEVGVGEQEIKKIVEGELVESELRFKEPFESISSASFITETVNENQTKVKWTFKGPSPFPLNVMCFIFNMKKSMHKDMQQGLENLKKKVESQT